MPSVIGETTSTNVSPRAMTALRRPKWPTPGIVEWVGERQVGAEVRDDRVEIARDEDCLAEPEHGRA